MTSPRPVDRTLAQTFVDFLVADWDRKKAILADHPELLAPGAIESIQDALRGRASVDIVATVDRYAALLRQCRELGIEEAFTRDVFDRAIESPTLSDDSLSGLSDHDRIAALQNLGLALHRRYDRAGDRQDLDAAISRYEAALAAEPVAAPERYRVLDALGAAYRARFARAGDPADLDRAIAMQEHHVGSAPPEERARALVNLAVALQERFQARGDESDLERAAEHQRSAVEAIEEGNPDRPAALSNLASTLGMLFEATGRASVLDEALACARSAVTGVAPKSERYAALTTLANLHFVRFRRSGDVADVDEMVQLYRAAVEDVPPQSPQRARVHAALGTALEARYARTRDRRDLEAALAEHSRAVAGTSPGSPSLPSALLNLASSRLALYKLTGSRSDLDAAVKASRRALDATPVSAPGHPTALDALGNALRVRYDDTQLLDDLDAGIELHRAALAATPLESPARAGRLVNLGIGLANREVRLHDVRDRDEAREALRSGTALALETRPDAALTAAQLWVKWALMRRAWAEAVEAGNLGKAAVDALVAVQVEDRAAQASWLREASGLSRHIAYAWAMQREGLRAVAALERGRAVLLTGALTSRTALHRLQAAGREDVVAAYRAAAAQLSASAASSVGGPDSAPEATEHALHAAGGQPGNAREKLRAALAAAVADIRAVPGYEDFARPPSDDAAVEWAKNAARSAPLSYILSATPGGVAVTVRPDGAVTITGLPGLTDAHVDRRSRDYLTAFRAERDNPDDPDARQRWLETLDGTTGWLWDVAMGPLLETLSYGGASRTTLVPTGLLALLPLHAAWTSQGAGRRRYTLDDVAIRYTPNARAVVAADSAAPEQPDSVVVVSDPWPSKGRPLHAAPVEVRELLRLFPGSEHVSRDKATRAAVLDALGRHPVAHFACHAAANPDDAFSSGILLAWDEPLTVRELLEQRLDGVMLAVLSACETAVPGTEVVDEVIGLPASLLEAGAGGVVGSLWSVDDASTMAVMTQFYRLWRTESQAPADALRGAQQWLRGATSRQLAAAYPDVAWRDVEQAGERPYQHPYWWAGFTYTGR